MGRSTYCDIRGQPLRKPRIKRMNGEHLLQRWEPDDILNTIRADAAFLVIVPGSPKTTL